jgi:hypothetical protein
VPLLKYHKTKDGLAQLSKPHPAYSASYCPSRRALQRTKDFVGGLMTKVEDQRGARRDIATTKKAQLMKIFVFRDNCHAIGTRVFPNRPVVCFVQIDVSDML